MKRGGGGKRRGREGERGRGREEEREIRKSRMETLDLPCLKSMKNIERVVKEVTILVKHEECVMSQDGQKLQGGMAIDAMKSQKVKK